MSLAYSLIVRSEENMPLPAVDIIDIFVQFALSLYVRSTSSCKSGGRIIIHPHVQAQRVCNAPSQLSLQERALSHVLKMHASQNHHACCF